MDIREMIAKMGGIQSMASELGLSEQEATSGAAALAPAILGGFERQAAPNVDGGLPTLIKELGGADLLDDVRSAHPTEVTRGNEVLASIFGSKDVSRAVAADASAKSGVSSAMLKKMLPIVAMMVAGYMAKQKGNTAETAGSGLGRSVLEGILGRMGQR